MPSGRVHRALSDCEGRLICDFPCGAGSTSLPRFVFIPRFGTTETAPAPCIRRFGATETALVLLLLPNVPHENFAVPRFLPASPPSLVGEGSGVGSVYPSLKESFRPHPHPLPLKGGENLRINHHLPLDMRGEALIFPLLYITSASPFHLPFSGENNSPELRPGLVGHAFT